MAVGTPISETVLGGDFGSFATEVIAIGEHGLGTGSIQVVGGEKANVAVGADGHESRGLDIAVGGVNDAGTAEGAWDRFFDFKE